MTEQEKEEMKNRLAEIDQVVAINREDLVFELRFAENAYSRRAEEYRDACARLPSNAHSFELFLNESNGKYETPPVGAVAKTLQKVDPRDLQDGLAYLCRLADKMDTAAMRLDMHDNPDNWREWIKDSYRNHQPDKENWPVFG